MTGSYFTDWEKRRNARRGTNPIAADRVQANLEVGNKNTMNIVKTRKQTLQQASGLDKRGYNAATQRYNTAVNKLKIGDKGTEVASFSDTLGAAQDSGRSIADQVKIMSPQGLETVFDSGTTVKDAAQTTKSAKDAATAAKIFDGTPKGTQLGLSAIALVASAVQAMNIGAKAGNTGKEGGGNFNYDPDYLIG